MCVLTVAPRNCVLLKCESEGIENPMRLQDLFVLQANMLYNVNHVCIPINQFDR